MWKDVDKSWEAAWKLFTHLSVDGSAEKLSQVIPNQYQTLIQPRGLRRNGGMWSRPLPVMGNYGMESL